MKLLILFVSFIFLADGVKAQNNQINSLPEGKYETIVKQNQYKWSMGDIILMDGSHYKLSSEEEIGEYKFSSTAQRLFFISGPLKNVFAKTTSIGNKPVIIIPAAENEQQGLKLAAADVWGYYKK